MRMAQRPATFWGAMRTIVIADAVMGLDNVLAVAGAAHGSYLLVVAGLLISVPDRGLGQHARAEAGGPLSRAWSIWARPCWSARR